MNSHSSGFPAIRRSIFVLAAAACALILSACEQFSAPSDEGVCWQRIGATSGKPRFSVLARNISSLENCAVLLEAVRLQGGGNSNGAFQGYYIYVDEDRIASSSNPSGRGYPILQPPQREAVDAELRRLIKARGGQMPNAANINLERK
ncbi:MAG TPA: hypothetical protein VFE03_00715 [Caulobacteraceae bacterium]|nr:hypothetical protein [Caulobacteraceae bacterium]